MANVKITELTALTNPASSDVLPIVDVGADETKKVTIADLLENAGDGSAANPAFSFDNDKNTGIYRPGVDQLAISTGGTGKLFIDSSGRLGVGASAPSANIHLAKTSSPTIYIQSENAITNTFGELRFGNGTGATTALSSLKSYRVSSGNAATALSFETTNTTGTTSEVMRIDDFGRILVGTSSDSGGALLQVNGDRVRIATAKTPASASDTGTTGEVSWDANYIYVCTATNTWKRAALSTW